MAGNLSFEQLKNDIASGEIDTVLVCIVDMQGRLIGKRFLRFVFCGIRLRRNAWLQLSARQRHRHGACARLSGSLLVEGLWRFRHEARHVDMRRIPCSKRPRSYWPMCRITITMKICLTRPRGILKKQVARLKERGWMAYFASELEFFLFEETYDSAREKKWSSLNTASPYIGDYVIGITSKEEPYMRAIRNGLNGAGIPVENSKG